MQKNSERKITSVLKYYDHFSGLTKNYGKSLNQMESLKQTGIWIEKNIYVTTANPIYKKHV